MCAGVDFDRLRQIEDDAVAPRAEDGFGDGQDQRMPDERGGMARTPQQRPETLGARAIEAAFAKGRRLETRRQFSLKRGNGIGRQNILDDAIAIGERSEEHTSELQSLMRISYAVFCLNKKTTQTKKKT